MAVVTVLLDAIMWITSTVYSVTTTCVWPIAHSVLAVVVLCLLQDYQKQLSTQTQDERQTYNATEPGTDLEKLKDKLLKEVQEDSEKKAQLETEVINKTQARDKLEQEIKKLQKDIDEGEEKHNNEIEELTKEISSLFQRSQSRKKLIEDMKTKILLENQRQTELKAEIKGKKQELETLEHRIDKLRDDIKKREENQHALIVETLQAEKNDLLQEKTRQDQSIEEMKTKIQLGNQRQAEMKAEIKEKKQELEKQEHKIAQLQADIQRIEEQHKTGVENLQAEINHLTNEKKIGEQCIAELQADNQRKEEQHNTRVENLQAEIDDLIEKKEKGEQHIAQLQADIQEIEEQHSTGVANLQAEINDLMQEKEKGEQHIDYQSLELAFLSAQIECLRKDQQLTGRELELQIQEQGNIESQKEWLCQRIAHLEAEAEQGILPEEKQSEVHELKSQMQEVKTALETIIKTHERLHGEQTQLTSEMQRLESDKRMDEHLQNLCKDIDQVRTMLVQKCSDINKDVQGLTSEQNIEGMIKVSKFEHSRGQTIYDENILNVIQTIFIAFVIPQNILHLFHHYDRDVLNQDNIESVQRITDHSGRHRGAFELLNLLVRYKDWFPCLLKVLRDPGVKQSHVADMMENAVEMEGRIQQFNDEHPQRGTVHDENILNAIRKSFIDYVSPQDILSLFHHYDTGVLIQNDIDFVRQVTGHSGRHRGASELLNLLVRYKDWFPCLLKVLRDPRVKRSHVADKMENAVASHMRDQENQERTEVKTLLDDADHSDSQCETDGIDQSTMDYDYDDTNPFTRDSEENSYREQDEESVNIPTNSNVTPLMKAAWNGQLTTLKSLLNAGADINMVDSENVTALMKAAQKGHYMCVEELASSSQCAIDHANNNGATALMLAANGGHIQCVEILIKHRANVNARDGGGVTSLMMAVFNRFGVCAKMLVQVGADVNIQDANGDTALMRAAEVGDLDMLEVLIKAGAQISLKNKNGEAAFNYAYAHGHIKCSARLKENFLIDAVTDDKVSLVKAIIEAGIDINLPDGNNETALMHAASHGKTRCLKLLLDAGATVDQTNPNGYTAICFAVASNQAGCVKALIEENAEINVCDETGVTPLMNAAAGGFAECLEFLLRAQPNINQTDSEGNTALMWAEKMGHADCVKQIRGSKGISARQKK